MGSIAMERTEEMTDTTERVDEDAIEARTSTPNRAGLRLLAGFMFVNVGLVLALSWSTYEMGQQLDTTNQVLNKQLAASGELSKKLDAALEQHTALESELSELRQHVSSQSEEDVIFLKIVVTKREIDRNLARKIAQHVHHYARAYGQDPDLVLAIIATESDFDPDAVSSVGALGLMQVMPQWKQVLGIRENLTEPETSIRYGLQILGFYRNMYKDLEMALTAYNRGPGPVDMALMRGKSPLNGYAPRVLQTYKELQSLRVGMKVG